MVHTAFRRLATNDPRSSRDGPCCQIREPPEREARNGGSWAWGLSLATLRATADFAIRPFAEKAHNITRWTEFGSGGHFPALEVPDLLTSDIRAFFGSLTG